MPVLCEKKSMGIFNKNDDSTQIIFSLGKGTEFSMYLQEYIKKKKRNKSRSTKHSYLLFETNIE